MAKIETHQMPGKEMADMILSLSQAGYEAQMASYDAMDGRAGAVIGYVAIAGGILGYSLGDGKVGALAGGVACGALVLFTAAVVLALKARSTRDMIGPASALQTLDYWEGVGSDAEAFRAVIEAGDEAWRSVYDAVCMREKWLRGAFCILALGFVMMALSVVANML